MYTQRTTYGPFGPRSSESHLGPWPRWRNLSGRQWSLDWRLSLFLLDLRLRNVVVALDTNRGWTCAHIYVRIRTYRIIRDPNNLRSWNFDHNNLNNSRSQKKYLFLESRIISTNTVCIVMEEAYNTVGSLTRVNSFIDEVQYLSLLSIITNSK